MNELTKTDYDVMDVLMEGPETISGIALETAIPTMTVRRSIHKLRTLGYVNERHLERSGFCKSGPIYELTRTRKAA